MINKRFDLLKRICREHRQADGELSKKLLAYYKEVRGLGKGYDCFLKEFPNVEDKKNKANKELKDFGIDFNVSDGYLTTTSILMVLNAISEED